MRRTVIGFFTSLLGVLSSPALQAHGTDALAGRAPAPDSPPPPPRKRKGKTTSRRAWWRSSNDRVRTHCDGTSECARRRRQIEAGTLMTTERIQRGLALRRGPVWVGVDYSSEPDRTEYFPIVISSEGNRP